MRPCSPPRPLWLPAVLLGMLSGCSPSMEPAPEFEQVGLAVLPDGSPDLMAFSKLAPWPHTDGDFLYSGCYVQAPLAREPVADRCFMVVDVSDPERPRRRATIHAFNPELSPAPPAGHPVWAADYPFPNLPTSSPCVVEWSDPDILAGAAPPPCWDPAWNTQTHYVAAVPGRLLAVNLERFRYGTDRQANLAGVRFYDISDPLNPVLVSEWHAPVSPPDPTTGIYPDSRGVHHFNFHGDQLYLGTEYEGYIGKILVILDLSDVSTPHELGRWWLPGQKTPEEDSQRDWVQQPLFSRPIVELEPGLWSRHVGMHYVTVEDTTAYLAYHQAGLILLDVTDPQSPSMLSWVNYLQPDSGSVNDRACRKAAGGRAAACGNSHTARRIPGTDLLMVEDEYFTCPFGHVRLFDVSNPASPVVTGQLVLEETLACDSDQPLRTALASQFPLRGPSAHLGNPWNDYIYLTAWYGLGLVAFDYSDPAAPMPIARHGYRISDDLPQADERFAGADTYDVIIGPKGHLYVSDGTGGLRVLRLRDAGHHRH